MIKKYLCKVLVVLTFTIYGLELNSIGASASWKQDSNGWWNTEGSSYSIGWKEIDGKWYYFYPDGYMAHDTVISGFKLGFDGAWIDIQPSTLDEKIVDVTVGTAEEFVNALGSNKRIILKPGVYNLSTINQVDKSDNSVTWETVQDGKELNLKNIHNLTIEGMNSGKVEIKVAPRFANIINFTNVQNITIKNIVAGHTPAEYECNAGVLKFTNSNDISIMSSELYGCGSIGLSLNDVKRLNASNCTIDHCSLRAIQLYNSETINFKETNIVNHEAYSNIIMVENSKDITFEKCVMSDNHNFGWSFIEALSKSNILLDKCVIKNNFQSSDSNVRNDKIYFFNTTDYLGNSDSKITVKNSEINNNRCDYLLTNKDNVEFDNCTITNNVWK